MLKKFLFLGAVSCLTFGMTACDEGEFNNLACDSAAYVSDCVGDHNYMTCENNVLVLHECALNEKCIKQPAMPALCYIDPLMPPLPTPPNTTVNCYENTRRCSGKVLQVCRYNQWTDERICGVNCTQGAESGKASCTGAPGDAAIDRPKPVEPETPVDPQPEQPAA